MMPAAIHEETSDWIYSSMRDEAGFAEILPFFVDELPDKQINLRELGIADDYENLRREAHKLRGSAGGYGFQTLSTLAGQLEDSCKNAPRDESTILRNLNELLDHLARVRA